MYDRTKTSEQSYNEHFHLQYNEKKSGYDIIKELHDNSQDKLFVKCRKIFSLKYVYELNLSLDNLKIELQRNKSILLSTIQASDGVHSIPIVFHNNNFHYIETRRDAPTKILNCPTDYLECYDKMLMKAIV